MIVKFTGKVGPSNLNDSYAKPFVVYGKDRAEAIDKAVALSGFRESDAAVWFNSFEEVAPALHDNETENTDGNR